MGRRDVVSEVSVENSLKKKSRKKRRAPEDDAPILEDKVHDKGEDADGTQIDDNEPTMADQLAILDLDNKKDTEIQEKAEPPKTQPPSADSVHVLLKQALHADDRALLLDCLYNQDDKSRGAVLACTLPWLKSLLLQHSSMIMSQESSLPALNSLYQLIESRVANLNPAMHLSSSLDLLYAGVDDEGVDEYDTAPPVIYEDYDESDEEESEEDAMETDEETKEPEDFSGLSDADLSEGFSD